MKKVKKENEVKFNMYTLSIIPSKNVEERIDGAFSYWKDDNGGRISFRVLYNHVPIKVDLNEENLKIYNETVGSDLNDKNYFGILEIFAKKNDGFEKYTKIQKPSRCYNNKSFQIVFLSEDGKRIFSPKIYVFSKKRKKRCTEKRFTRCTKCCAENVCTARPPLKRQRVNDTIKKIFIDEIYDEISALWKMQEKIQSQQKELLRLQRDSYQLQKKNSKILESIIMSKYDYNSYELWNNVEEQEMGHSSLLPKEWCPDLCNYTFP